MMEERNPWEERIMKIEIFADLVCPFCYVGNGIVRKWAESLEEEVTILHRSFELDPNSSKRESKNTVEGLAKKYGITEEEAKDRMGSVASMAKKEGLPMEIFKSVSANTHDLHRLLYLAKEEGKEEALLTAFYEAHFAKGIALNEQKEVLKITGAVGLAEEKVLEVLESEAYEDALAKDRTLATALKIQGVPYMVFNETYAISGAQPVEVLNELYETLKNETQKN